MSGVVVVVLGKIFVVALSKRGTEQRCYGGGDKEKVKNKKKKKQQKMKERKEKKDYQRLENFT